MESSGFKELSPPPFDTPAYFMSKNLVLEAVDMYTNSKILVRETRITMVIMGNVLIRKDHPFKTYT